MATTVDTLLVRIESDMRDVRRDLNRLERDTRQTSNKVGKSLGAIGNVARIAIGGVLVQQLLRGTLALTNFASDMEEMSQMSEAVFGSFIHTVRNQLGEFADTVGRSRFELEAMAASVQDTFVPLGFARGEAADLSIQLTKLAVDVASFKNELEPDVMAAFQSALVGNHEAVRRFGIVITEAELNAELFRMGITKQAKDVDAATKVQARLNLIMAGTADAQGDAARTSDSYANLVRKLKGELDELGADLGSELLPIMKDIVIFTTEATEAFRDFLAAMGIGGSEAQKLTRATIDRMKAEEDLAKTLERVRFLVTAGIYDQATANKHLHEAQMELAEAVLAEEEAAKKLLLSKGLITEETEKQAEATKNVKKELSDVEKFITAQAQEQEILMLKLQGASEATIAQRQASHDLGKEYTENKALVDKTIEVTATMTARLNEQTEATKKLAEAQRERDAQNQAGKKQLDDLIAQEAILKAQIDGATESEIAQMEAAFNMINLEGGRSEQILKQIELNHQLQAQLSAKQKKERQGIEFVKSLQTEEDKLKQTLEGVNAAFKAGQIDAPEYMNALDTLALEMDRLDPMFKSVEDAARQAGDAIADSLADAVVEGKLSMDSFHNIFKSFVKQIIAEAIKTFIVRKIMSSMFMGFAGGGSVGQGANSYIPAGLAGGGNIPRRATGGPVLVGERGPELFVPHSAGVIKNNHDTKNMLGGGQPVVVNQHFNIETGVADTVRAEILTLMPRIQAETVRAVTDSKRRGTGISKVFA